MGILDPFSAFYYSVAPDKKKVGREPIYQAVSRTGHQESRLAHLYTTRRTVLATSHGPRLPFYEWARPVL
jgi:hypothetical protein